MDLYCDNCKFANTSKTGLKCRIYNTDLGQSILKVSRLQKCKLENSKVYMTPENK